MSNRRDDLQAGNRLFVLSFIGHVDSGRVLEEYDGGLNKFRQDLPRRHGLCSTDLKSKESFGRCTAFGNKCVNLWGQD